MADDPEQPVYIVGFGSLLSETSARCTFPELRDFRLARVHGWRRVFQHTPMFFIEQGIANMATRESSSLSAEECRGHSLVVALFAITAAQLPDFYRRESDLRFEFVVPHTLDTDEPLPFRAIMCAASTDQHYIDVHFDGCRSTFESHLAKHGMSKIWSDDLLPSRVYLRHCLLAAKKLGALVYDNLLHHTFLGDRRTTLAQYLDAEPSRLHSILAEEPPPALAVRYGGF